MLNQDGKKISFEITDYETIHDGRPVLFILPGGPGLDSSAYKPYYSQFSSVAHLVFIDPRGCGLSEKYQSTSDYTMEGYMLDVEALYHHLKLEKIYLLGVSYGSMVALNFAIKYQDTIKIEKLFLIGGASSYRFIEQAKKNLRLRGSQEQIEICNKWLWEGKFNTTDDLAEFGLVMRPLYSLKAARESNQAPYQTKWSVDPVNEAWQTKFWHFDLVEQLRHIKAKETCIIFGKYDWVNDPSFAIEMHNHIPSSQLYLLESGHSIVADQPEQLKSILLSHINNTAKTMY